MPASRKDRGGVRRASLPADRPLPALQERSKATTERLLAAAEALLREGGSDAATLRAIADRAGVSLGIVYRRFPDKDAVLRAVYVRFFERVREANELALPNAANRSMRRASLRRLALSLAAGIADGYRLHRPLLRALLLYARSHQDRDFRTRAATLNAATFAGLERLLLSRPEVAARPRPEIAVRFAIAALASLFQERILFEDVVTTPHISQSVLVTEAARMITAYLGGTA